MTYKKGDIVLCKANFTVYDTEVYEFNKNIYYLITDTYTYPDNVGGNSYIQLYIEKSKLTCNMLKKDFDSHFYTVKDVRKMKLDKINNV